MYKIIGGDQTEYGPVSAEQLRQWIAEGRADSNTQVQLEGTNEWRPLRDFPEFAASFATAQPMPTPGPSAGYAPPVAPLPVMGESGRVLALQQVSGPSIGLIIAAVLGILGAALDILLNALGMGFNTMQGNNPMGVPAWAFVGAVQVVIQVASLLASIFILFGAIKMRKLESHGLCIAACILAMIDFANCCCIVGLPLGIWALVVLSKPEVKQYFT
ncbi:MAG TPA: DUF4339 domain-containing protein [Verrucomicrobiae bacterium]|jgi:hypothetical protein|nr:DUF4339 domain-containing protein [Verrucomicrobiae bacterium]